MRCQRPGRRGSAGGAVPCCGRPRLEELADPGPHQEWEGVSLDREGRVVALSLSLRDREIPPELGSLENLRELDIG